MPLPTVFISFYLIQEEKNLQNILTILPEGVLIYDSALTNLKFANKISNYLLFQDVGKELELLISNNDDLKDTTISAVDKLNNLKSVINANIADMKVIEITYKQRSGKKIKKEIQFMTLLRRLKNLPFSSATIKIKNTKR